MCSCLLIKCRNKFVNYFGHQFFKYNYICLVLYEDIV